MRATAKRPTHILYEIVQPFDPADHIGECEIGAISAPDEDGACRVAFSHPLARINPDHIIARRCPSGRNRRARQGGAA